MGKIARSIETSPSAVDNPRKKNDGLKAPLCLSLCPSAAVVRDAFIFICELARIKGRSIKGGTKKLPGAHQIAIEGGAKHADGVFLCFFL